MDGQKMIYSNLSGSMAEVIKYCVMFNHTNIFLKMNIVKNYKFLQRETRRKNETYFEH